MLTDQNRNFIMASIAIEKLEITAYRFDAINNQIITEKFLSQLREMGGSVFTIKGSLKTHGLRDPYISVNRRMTKTTKPV